MFLKLKGAQMLQSCLRAAWNGLPLATREMHPSFESLVVVNTPGLQASLMDIHHDTSFKSILEDDSISLTTRPRIRSCSGKGVRLWLVVKPIRAFHIAHSTFTSTLPFHFGLIQHLACSLLTCECGHELDASSMHLTCYLFKGQWITTHDAIWNVMYAFAQ
jgi:hypothetical protein